MQDRDADVAGGVDCARRGKYMWMGIFFEGGKKGGRGGGEVLFGWKIGDLKDIFGGRRGYSGGKVRWAR